MRILLLLRGAPGCGKSTWVEENGLNGYTLSADSIRLLYQSPVMRADGTEGISPAEDEAVWILRTFLCRKSKVPTGIQLIKPDELDSVRIKIRDLSCYKKSIISAISTAVIPYYSAILRITAALKRMKCISLWVIILTEELKMQS